MNTFHDTVTALILSGHNGKAVCWDRLGHWEIHDEGDFLPPGMRQIITGNEPGMLMGSSGRHHSVIEDLQTQIHSLYEAAT